MSEVKIEPHLGRHVHEIVNLDSRCFKEDCWDYDQIADFLSRGQCAVAVLNDVVVGAVLYKFESNPKIMKLVRVFVHPDYQRKGIGKKLVRYVEDRRTTKRPLAMATIIQSNMIGQIFMRSLGWKCRDITKNCFGTGIDGYVFLSVRTFGEKKTVDK